MEHRRMEVAEFKRLLDNGLGSAILFLQKNDSLPYRDVILNACLHNLAYDAQVEENRITYMLDVIKQTGDAAFYRHEILAATKAISSDTDEYDATQLVNLTAHWAEQGDQEALALLYEQFTAHISNDDITYAAGMNLVDIDSIKGFLFIAAQLGALVLANNTYEAEDYFLTAINEKVGKDIVMRSAQEANDSRVVAYMNAVLESQTTRKERRQSRRIATRDLIYDQVNELISNASSDHLRSFGAWGRQASAADLRRAANALVIEHNPRKIYQYLTIFLDAEFPLSPEPLLTLTHHEDKQIAAVAINVLENVQHLMVRQFALEMIGQSYCACHMAGLLAKNFEDGDWLLIEQLTRRDWIREEWHDLGYSAKHIFELHPSLQATPVFLTLYDKGSCTNCRQDFLNYLQELDAVPDWMIEECRYDANTDIREMFSEKPSN